METDKFFISYKFTGVPLQKLHTQIDPIVAAITKQYGRNNVFCNLYYNDIYLAEGYTVKEIMNHCVNALKTCDTYIAFVTDMFGGGMAIECGYAYCLGKTIITCIPSCARQDNYKSLIGISSIVISYDNIDDLCDKLVKVI